jgi:hypothetical protein
MGTEKTVSIVQRRDPTALLAENPQVNVVEFQAGPFCQGVPADDLEVELNAVRHNRSKFTNLYFYAYHFRRLVSLGLPEHNIQQVLGYRKFVNGNPPLSEASLILTCHILLQNSLRPRILRVSPDPIPDNLNRQFALANTGQKRKKMGVKTGGSEALVHNLLRPH